MYRFITHLLFLLAISVFLGSGAQADSNRSAWGGIISGREVALIWQHGTTREAAKNAVINELESLGYADEVHWKNYKGSVSVALGLILSVRGYISDNAIVIEKCSGTCGRQALNEARNVLSRLFPGGDIPALYSSTVAGQDWEITQNLSNYPK